MNNQNLNNLVTALAAATDGIAPPPAKKRARGKKGEVIPREKRLEQNRKAAIESRRRKKVMVSSAWLCHRWRRVDFLPFTVPCVAMCHLLLVELCLFPPSSSRSCVLFPHHLFITFFPS